MDRIISTIHGEALLDCVLRIKIAVVAVTSPHLRLI